MKILIVEDIPGKHEEIRSVLIKSCAHADIHHACCFVDALSSLRDDYFDLLILDMVIPLRKGEDPNVSLGISLLNEVFDGVDARPPDHIICLSEYLGMLDEIKEATRRRLVHAVKYDEIDATWVSLLGEKLDYVGKCVTRSLNSPQDYLCDVGIVVSYPTVELEAILELKTQISAEFNKLDELHYYLASWSRPNTKLKVVACAAPSMGMTAACVTAGKLINRWRPRYLVMTGIAAGTDEELKFGDILVADSCYDYGSGKIREEEGERLFVPSPQQLLIASDLKALLQKWESTQRGMADIARGCVRGNGYQPKMKLGIIATGAAVVQSKEFVEEIKQASRKVVGLEMEAYGVFQAASLSSHPKPKVMVAKSVSDFANLAKDDQAQRLAAFTSAQLVHKFFTEEEELDFSK